MKILRLATLVLSLSVALPGVAHADPATIGSFIFQGLYSLGLPGALANTIANLALPALALGASIFLRPSTQGLTPEDAKNTFETGDSSVIEGIGRVRIGGMQAFGNATSEGTRARLVCRLQGPIDAVEQYFVGGREVTVEANGDVSSPPWAKPGGSWAKWLDKRGDGTETAWSDLLSLFSALWTSAHRVRGIAQSLVLWYNPGLDDPKYFSLYQSGVPQTEQVIRASLIYDPRDVTQAVGTPSTWKWSDNGILACAHVLRRDPAFGASAFDWDLIAAEATRADALVATKTGTEKRARAWGIWTWETPRSDTMQKLLASIGAELRLTDEGKVWFQLIDDNPTSEITFAPKDQYELSWRSGPEAVDRPNICRVSYYSPERNYEIAEIDMSGVAWAKIDDEVATYGPKYFDVELPFCPSASQAQRIARRMFAQARGDSGSLSTNMVGLSAWGLLYGTIEIPDLGDILKVRMEAPRIDDQNGSVDIPFLVWPMLPAWNTSTDEAPAPEDIPEIGYETTLTTPSTPSNATQVVYLDGAKEFRIQYALPSETRDTIEATCRVYSGSLPGAYQSMTETDSLAWIAADFTGSLTDSRVRVFNGDEGSYFSPVLNAVAAVDNAPCGAPTTVSATTTNTTPTATISAIMKAPELRAVAIRLERKVGIGSFVVIDTKKVRTDQHVTFSDSVSGTIGQLVTWRFVTLTSDSTPGTVVDYSVTISPDT